MTGAEAQAVLLGIAGQCPNTGGDAVYRARSLYQLQHPEMRWEDGVLCEPAARNVMWGALPVQATVSRLKVWPNPASGIFFIELPASETDDITLEIFDSRGLIYDTKAIWKSDHLAQFDLSHFPAGVYFLRVKCKQRVLGLERLILSN